MPTHHCRAGFGAHGGENLPTDFVSARRVSLPSPSDVLAICRRGDRTPRLVGGRVDDPRTPVALPPIRHFWLGLCGRRIAAGRTLVFAMALRPVARHQYDAAEAVGTSRLAASVWT